MVAAVRFGRGGMSHLPEIVVTEFLGRRIAIWSSGQVIHGPLYPHCSGRSWGVRDCEPSTPRREPATRLPHTPCGPPHTFVGRGLTGRSMRTMSVSKAVETVLWETKL